MASLILDWSEHPPPEWTGGAVTVAARPKVVSWRDMPSADPGTTDCRIAKARLTISRTTRTRIGSLYRPAVAAP